MYLMGILTISWLFILLTLLCLALAGFALRAVNGKVFADLPGICMPSIGTGMLGLMAAVNALS
jgi:hypothetical protein